MLANTGPGTNTRLRFPVSGFSWMMSVPVMSEGIRSGGELDPLETQGEDFGEGLDDHRLGESGNAGDDAVAADEEADQHLLHRLLLADDPLADLAGDAFGGLAHPPGEIAVGNLGRFGDRRRAAARVQVLI